MNITSLLKKGMKSVKEKIKIKATSDGVIVEGKKCKTAEALVKLVKKVAKKDKTEGKTYGTAWTKMAISYRDAILLKPFKLDENSEKFYEAFIKKFKNKTVVPATLDKFYDKYTIDMDPKIKTDKIAPVYIALSFYAMREKSLSHSVNECKPIEYAGHIFKNPVHLLEETKKEFDLVFKTTMKKQEKIKALWREAANAAIAANENTYFKYYGPGTEAFQEFQEQMVFINNTGSKECAAYKFFYLNGVMKKSITKENISRENAMFYNFRKHPEQFEIAFTSGSEKTDPKIIDTNTVTYDCLILWHDRKPMMDAVNGFLAAAEGKMDKARETLYVKEAIEAGETLYSIIKELKEIAACKSELEADEVAKNHGRKASITRKSFSAKSPSENERKKNNKDRRKSI